MHNIVDQFDLEQIMFDVGTAGVGYIDAGNLELFELLRLNGRLSLKHQKEADAIKAANRQRRGRSK